MVLPAAITTILVGVTIGVTLYLFTNMFGNHNSVQEAQYSHNFIPRERPVFDKDDDCCVCQTPFNSKHRVKEMRCGHFLHIKCYNELIVHSHNCPLCRKFIM